MRMPVLNRWQWLYIQLILMMCVMMAVSFLPEIFPGFFGDWQCGGYLDRWTDSEQVIINSSCLYNSNDHAAGSWHWGWRHWLLIIFGLVLCIVNAVRLITFWERRPQA